MSDHGSPPHRPDPYGAVPPARPYATWVDRVVATLWDVLYLWPAYVVIVAGFVALGVGIGLASSDGGGAVGILVAAVGGIAVLAGYVWAFVRHVMNYMVDQGRTG